MAAGCFTWLKEGENFLADFYIKSIMCFRNKLWLGKDFMSHLILQISLKSVWGKLLRRKLPCQFCQMASSRSLWLRRQFLLFKSQSQITKMLNWFRFSFRMVHGCKMRVSSSIVWLKIPFGLCVVVCAMLLPQAVLITFIQRRRKLLMKGWLLDAEENNV